MVAVSRLVWWRKIRRWTWPCLKSRQRFACTAGRRFIEAARGRACLRPGAPVGAERRCHGGNCSGLGKITGVRSRSSADYIRSDVSLAPGNSGGPLLNARGQVVGINSMIFGGDLSVAVPSHVALDWLGHAGKRAYLGVGVRPVRINSSRCRRTYHRCSRDQPGSRRAGKSFGH